MVGSLLLELFCEKLCCASVGHCFVIAHACTDFASSLALEQHCRICLLNADKQLGLILSSLAAGTLKRSFECEQTNRGFRRNVGIRFENGMYCYVR